MFFVATTFTREPIRQGLDLDQNRPQHHHPPSMEASPARTTTLEQVAAVRAHGHAFPHAATWITVLLAPAPVVRV